jgi:hypothetical protein
LEPFAHVLRVQTALMSLTEFAVIVFGLFAGYWVVGKLFFRRPGNPPADAESAPPTSA